MSQTAECRLNPTKALPLLFGVFGLSCVAGLVSLVLAVRRKAVPPALAGLLATTATTPFVILAATMLLTRSGAAPMFWYSVRAEAGIVVGALLVAYAVAFIGALPAHAAFQRRHWTRYWHYALLGIALGAAPFLAFDVYVLLVAHSPAREIATGIDDAIRWLTLGSGCGLAAASLFWVLAVRPSSAA